MKLRAFALTLGLLAAPLPAEAQKVPKVGMLCTLTCSMLPVTRIPEDKAFLQGLREAGYVPAGGQVLAHG